MPAIAVAVLVVVVEN